MCTGGAVDDLRQALQVMTDALELGHWRVVLCPEPTCPGSHVAGPRQLVVWGVVLRVLARSMQLQAHGRVQDAWDQLCEAAGLLPRARRAPTLPGESALAALTPPPRDASLDEELAWRIARLVWREQSELTDLRNKFAPGLLKPRGELIEACIEHLCWIEFDPFVFSRPTSGMSAWDDGTSVARERSVLCLRGTRLRQFADATEGSRISKSVWIDIGGYRGLCCEALDRLADRPAPAPWCGAAGTSGLRVRVGRLRAWEHSRRWRDDLRYWR
jgi:hypothetical protein